MFGVVLLAGAIPYALALRTLLPLILPRTTLRDPILVQLVNIAALAIALFGCAWMFRDRPPNVENVPKPPEGPLPPPP
jgi:hypothetical protein